jgi:predicted nucleic acid-binding protein
MGTKYLLDSDVIIGYLDNKIPAAGMAFVSEIVDNVPNVSVISKIEVLRFNAPPKIEQVLSAFFDHSKLFQLDEEVVKITIDVCKQCKIKLPDAIIAATALSCNLTLLTRNIDDFKHVRGLISMNPWGILYA